MTSFLYLIYGGGEDHVNEIKFSILSLYKFIKQRIGEDIQIIVYSDQGDLFPGFPIVEHLFEEDVFLQWTSNGTYLHRAKNRVISDSIKRYNTDIIFVDSDTYFKKSPKTIINKINKKNTFLHKNEGPIIKCLPQNILAILVNRYYEINENEAYKISINTPMWNSGIIGISKENIKLLNDAVKLLDYTFDDTNYFNMEQFALGVILDKNTLVHESTNEVVHYWVKKERLFNRLRIKKILGDSDFLILHKRIKKFKLNSMKDNFFLDIYYRIKIKFLNFNYHFKEFKESLINLNKMIDKSKFDEAIIWEKLAYHNLELIDLKKLKFTHLQSALLLIQNINTKNMKLEYNWSKKHEEILSCMKKYED